MGYAKSFGYTASTDIVADEVAQNFQEARDSLQQLENADISTDVVTDYHIAKPDRISPTIWRCTSGVYVFSSTEYNELDKHFVTNHVKQSAYTTRVLYQDIPNACCDFFLEKAAHCVVEIYAYGEAVPNIKQSKVGDIQLFTLWVDGSKKDATFSYLADMDEASSGATAAVFTSFGPNRHVPICIFWADDLSAGSHTIKLQVDANLEYAWLNNITFTVDAAYAE